MIRVSIDGVSDCMRAFEKAPENMLKITKTALKDAARPLAKRYKASIPSRWKSLVKYRIVKGQMSGDLYALVGLFENHAVRGHQAKNGKIEDWMKAYWNNYGTLNHRASWHKFARPVRASSKRRRNNTGIRPKGFFEAAGLGWEGDFLENFKKSISKNINQIYDR